MGNVLEFKGFQELNHDELMFVDGGNWLGFGAALLGTVAIAATPFVAVTAGPGPAFETFSAGVFMLGVAQMSVRR